MLPAIPQQAAIRPFLLQCHHLDALATEVVGRVPLEGGGFHSTNATNLVFCGRDFSKMEEAYTASGLSHSSRSGDPVHRNSTSSPSCL
jgi:hypothetical protein